MTDIDEKIFFPLPNGIRGIYDAGTLVTDKENKMSKSPSAKLAIKSTPITKPVTDFPTAIQQVINGGVITKLEWNNPRKICYLDGVLKIQQDHVVQPWAISDADMLGRDWIVLDPYPPDQKAWNEFMTKYTKHPRLPGTDKLRSAKDEQNRRD